jgi:hypothetical protein
LGAIQTTLYEKDYGWYKNITGRATTEMACNSRFRNTKAKAWEDKVNEEIGGCHSY